MLMRLMGHVCGAPHVKLTRPLWVKRTERHPPGSQLVVPTCPRNCPQFLKDGLRIRRANTQVTGNLQICARNRIEGESITTITVAVESEQLCLLRQPAVDPPRGRLSGDEPTIALVTPPRSGKGAPKSLDSHSVERKASFGAGSIPLPRHVMSVRAFHRPDRQRFVPMNAFRSL